MNQTSVWDWMRLIECDVEKKDPSKQAFKDRRPVFQKGRCHEAGIDDMSERRPGNEFTGLAVVETPNATLLVSEGGYVRDDEYTVYWMDKGGKR